MNVFEQFADDNRGKRSQQKAPGTLPAASSPKGAAPLPQREEREEREAREEGKAAESEADRMFSLRRLDWNALASSAGARGQRSEQKICKVRWEE